MNRGYARERVDSVAFILSPSLNRFPNNSLVLRNNFFLNHLPHLVVQRVNNIHVCTVRHFSSRHEKKITFFCAVGESKAVNHKAVIQRNGRICLDGIIIAKINLDVRDLHCGGDSLSQDFPQTSDRDRCINRRRQNQRSLCK